MASHRNVTFNRQFGFHTNHMGAVPHSTVGHPRDIPAQNTPSFYEPVHAQSQLSTTAGSIVSANRQVQQVVTTSVQQQGQVISPQPQFRPQLSLVQQQQMVSSTVQTGQLQVLQVSSSQQQQFTPLRQQQYQITQPPKQQQVAQSSTTVVAVSPTIPNLPLPAATGQFAKKVKKHKYQMFANILKNLDYLTRPTKRQPSSKNSPEIDNSYRVKKSCCETIFDVSLQPAPVQQVDHFAGPLAVGKRIGLEIFKSLFQNASKRICNIAILFQFVFIAIDLSLDIASLAIGNKRAYVVIHLIFILIGLLLALGDGFVYVVSECCPCSCTGNCCSCWQTIKTKVDAARIVLPNIIVIPILICDLFDIMQFFAGCEDASETVYIGLIVFGIDILYTLVFLVINLTIAVKILRRIRLLSENVKLHTYRLFLVHSSLQIAGNFCMLATIGVQIWYENTGPNRQTGVRMSLALGFMCSIVCILPLFQLFFLILSYYYWFQENLVSLMVNFEGVNPKKVFNSEQEKTFKEIFEKRVPLKDIRDQLEKSIKEKSFWTKIRHPFANPSTQGYVVFPLVLCYSTFIGLAVKGYLAAKSIMIIDSITTGITISSLVLNAAVNLYLLVGIVVALIYFCIIFGASCKLLVCQFDKLLKQF